MSTLCFCIIFGYKRILHVFVQKGLVFSIWIAEIVEFVSPEYRQVAVIQNQFYACISKQEYSKYRVRVRNMRKRWQDILNTVAYIYCMNIKVTEKNGVKKLRM